VGGRRGFKVSPPPMKLLLYPKDYLPPIHGKNGIFEEMFDFFDEKMPFFRKILEPLKIFKKSAVKFSNFF
jgi:hypothetical protein